MANLENLSTEELIELKEGKEYELFHYQGYNPIHRRNVYNELKVIWKEEIRRNV